jgi:hypothetical protein
VYAARGDRPHAITIPFADKRIRVGTVDISRPPADVLAPVAQSRNLIRSIAASSSERPLLHSPICCCPGLLTGLGDPAAMVDNPIYGGLADLQLNHLVPALRVTVHREGSLGRLDEWA